MGIGSIGFSELVVIFVIVLVFFGPRRFPEIARSMGHAMREFRRSLNQIRRELEEADPRSSIPGRDLLNDIRSGRSGNWLDSTPNGRRSAGSSTPGERSAPASQKTGEAGAAGTSRESVPVPNPADPDQLPMFDAGPAPRGTPPDEGDAGPATDTSSG